MDTKERKTGVSEAEDTGPTLVPTPIWRSAHRSRGEKPLRTRRGEFKRAERFFDRQASDFPDIQQRMSRPPLLQLCARPLLRGEAIGKAALE